MTDLMIGNDQLLLIGHHVILLLITGDDDLDRLLEIRLDHALTTGTYRTKCCLVDDIGQLRTTRAGGCLCDGTEIDIFRHLDASGVHLQDVDTALEIRKLDRYTTVETARTKQCRIQGIRLVRRRQDDDGLRAVEAVHLRQELVQGLLTLIVATHRTVATLLTDGIDLIDEDDARRLFLRLLEEVTYLRRTHTDEHLDELGAGDGEERNVRLTGHSLGKQGLTGSRRADEQRTLRNMCTDLRILIRLLQVVDHLGQKLLRFILTGDVLKSHLVSVLRLVLTGVRLTEAAHTAEAAARTERARHALAEPVAEGPEQKDREDPGQKEIQQRAGLDWDRLIEVDTLPVEFLQYLCLGVLVLQSTGLAGDIGTVHRRNISDGIIAQVHLRDRLVVHRVHELRIARLTDRPCQQ